MNLGEDALTEWTDVAPCVQGGAEEEDWRRGEQQAVCSGGGVRCAGTTAEP